MPMSYRKLLFPIYGVLETPASYQGLTERHIQAIWLEQTLIKDLKTSQEEKVQVISPGVWNTEAGPDFIKAHIKIGDQEWRGDIEIHLSDESWEAHRHHLDERYNGVILHVSLWRPVARKPLRKQNQALIPQVYLEERLTTTLSHALTLVDLTRYPNKKSVQSGQCADRLFASLKEEKIKDLLTAASYWRLEQKCQSLKLNCPTSPVNLMSGGFAAVLGYKNNALGFQELFYYLLQFKTRAFPERLAIALGCCGFFDQHKKPEWDESAYYASLKAYWREHRSFISHQSPIRLDHRRPFNHPVRRLVYMAKWLTDPDFEIKENIFFMSWERGFSSLLVNRQSIITLRQQFFEIIPNYEDEYWNAHYTFEFQPQKKHLHLIGDGIRGEMLINSVFPLLYEKIKSRGNEKELRAFQVFYESFRSSPTRKKRYLSERFFGFTSKAKLLNRAQLVQGAYQLHKDFCSHFEASCEGCPFVDRYQAHYSA